MFEWLKKRKLDRLTESVKIYLTTNYREPKKVPDVKYSRDPNIRYSLDIDFDEKPKPEVKEPEIQYSSRIDKVQYSLRDNYDSDTIQNAMRNLSETESPLRTLKTLDENTNMSFVDKMLEYINIKHLRDSYVYKAAQIDRRLFSKIVSDSTYKPAKDTCIALCLAMKLTLEETNDLLSRAGYTFSHSSKRDVILEYFFREQVHSLNDVNEILFRLEQKPLGRQMS